MPPARPYIYNIYICSIWSVCRCFTTLCVCDVEIHGYTYRGSISPDILLWVYAIVCKGRIRSDPYILLLSLYLSSVCPLTLIQHLRVLPIPPP